MVTINVKTPEGEAIVIVRTFGDRVFLSVSLEDNGDVEVQLSLDEAKAVAAALSDAASAK